MLCDLFRITPDGHGKTKESCLPGQGMATGVILKLLSARRTSQRYRHDETDTETFSETDTGRNQKIAKMPQKLSRNVPLTQK